MLQANMAFVSIMPMDTSVVDPFGIIDAIHRALKFIWQWAIDGCVVLLNSISGFYFDDFFSTLLQPISSANPDVFKRMLEVAQVVVLPVATVILALVATVELARNSSKFDGDGQMGLRIVAGTMFKYALLLYAVYNAPYILQAITEISQTIITGIGQVSETASGESNKAGLGETLRHALDGFGPGVIFLLLMLLLPWLITTIGQIYAAIQLVLRMVELYLLTAFAPLPVAFAGHPDTKSIAIGYLRGFGATAIHGATLLLALYLFQSYLKFAQFFKFGFLDTNISADEVQSGTDLFNWLLTAYPSMLFTGILLIFVVRASRQLAKTVVGMG